MITSPKCILILKPSSLGDIIHALPTLSALRKQFPQAKISWLVKAEWRGILEGNPDIDELIPVNFQLRDWWPLVRKLRNDKFDVVIDLQGLFRTAFLGFLSGARERIGFDLAREGSPWFYTHRVKLPDQHLRPWRLLDVHAVDRNLAVAKYLGADITHPTFCIPNREDDRLEVMRQLREAHVQDSDRLVALAPLSRLDIKCWPLDRFLAVAEILSQQWHCKIILLGSSSEQWVARTFSRLGKGRMIDMIGTLSVRQLGVLFRRVNLLIANDSAPIHIGAAVGIPVLGLFGPTHDVATGPYGSGRHRVLTAPLSCRPCGKRQCHHHTHKECLTLISVHDVLEAANAMLQTSADYVGQE